MFVSMVTCCGFRLMATYEQENRREMKKWRVVISESVLLKKLFWKFLLETSTTIIGQNLLKWLSHLSAREPENKECKLSSPWLGKAREKRAVGSLWIASAQSLAQRSCCPPGAALATKASPWLKCTPSANWLVFFDISLLHLWAGSHVQIKSSNWELNEIRESNNIYVNFWRYC